MCALIWPAGLLAPGDAAMVWPPPANTAIPPGTLLIHDAFTGSDGDLLSAHTIAPTNTPSATWQRFGILSLTNMAEIKNNRCMSYSWSTYAAICNPGVSDCTIETTIYTDPAVDIGGGFWNCIRYRVTNSGIPADGWYVRCIPGAPGSLAIIERTRSGAVTRATTSGNIPAGIYTLTLVLSGPDMTATLSNGLSVAYSSSLLQTATWHGLYAIDTSKNTLWFDDFKVYA